MASKRRVRERVCGQKKRFYSSKHALYGLRKTEEYVKGFLHYYRCPYCKWFHLGHRSREFSRV